MYINELSYVYVEIIKEYEEFMLNINMFMNIYKDEYFEYEIEMLLYIPFHSRNVLYINTIYVNFKMLLLLPIQ